MLGFGTATMAGSFAVPFRSIIRTVFGRLFLNPATIVLGSVGTLAAVGYVVTAIDSGEMSPPRVIGWAMGELWGTAQETAEARSASADFAATEAQQEALRRSDVATTIREQNSELFTLTMSDISLANLGLAAGAIINDGACALGDFARCGQSQPFRLQMVENRLSAADRLHSRPLSAQTGWHMGSRRDPWHSAEE